MQTSLLLLSIKLIHVKVDLQRVTLTRLYLHTRFDTAAAQLVIYRLPQTVT